MLQQYRYEIGPEEYLAYQKYHVEHDRAIASRIFWMRWLITLGILLVGVLLEAVGRIGMIAIIQFAILAVCAWVLIPQWMRDSMRKTAEKKYAPRITPLHRGDERRGGRSAHQRRRGDQCPAVRQH